ncbi:MAG: AMIN domain-containing protein [Acidobacteriota bacterium]|nr:AMIN domain-containing protein [Acidobacteriota bacterium]
MKAKPKRPEPVRRTAATERPARPISAPAPYWTAEEADAEAASAPAQRRSSDVEIEETPLPELTQPRAAAVAEVTPPAKPVAVPEPAPAMPEPAPAPAPAVVVDAAPPPALAVEAVAADAVVPAAAAALYAAPLDVPYGQEQALESPGLRNEAALWLKEVEIGPSRDGATAVRLVGEGEFLFKVFRLDRPERLVVDLPQVINLVSRPVLDGSGLVSVARSSQLRIEPVPVSRVSLELAAAAEVSLASDPEGLSLFLGEPGDYAAAYPPPPVVADAAAPAESMPEVAPEADPPETVLPQLAEADLDLPELRGLDPAANADLPALADFPIDAEYDPDLPLPTDLPEVTFRTDVLADIVPDVSRLPETAPEMPLPAGPSAIGYGMRGALWGPEPAGDQSTRLLSVEVGDGLGVELKVRGDGEFSWVAFRLEEPHRMVVDLFGVRHAASLANQQIGRGGVVAYRSSQFKRQPEAVSRIVVDLEDRLDVEVHGGNTGLSLRFSGSIAAE